MKKYFYFLLVLISCNNDLEINENWKDIPVIYGVLNPGSDENIDNISGSGKNYDHYVRVQKSFLGDGSALTYTQVSDSIYYDPDNIDVWLELLDSGTGESDGPFYLEYISPEEAVSIDVKDDGIFNSSSHMLYKIPDLASDLIPFADLRKLYKINVLNNNTGDTAFSTTNIVEPIDMQRPTPFPINNSILRFGDGVTQRIEINPSKNAKMYSLSLVFNYLEQNIEDFNNDISDNGIIDFVGSQKKSAVYNLGNFIASEQQILGQSSIDITKNISPVEFLEFLSSQIYSDENIVRYPLNSYNQGTGANIITGIYHRTIDLKITASNSELYTYLNANAPSYSFNQERPDYNNINNGIGHWSSRSVLNLDSLRLDNSTIDKISSDPITFNLNFPCYNINGLGTPDINGFFLNFGEDCLNE